MGDLEPDGVVPAVLADLPPVAATLRPVLNATGVVLHTNLGRAPLSVAARAAVLAAAGTTDVELDLATGRRGPARPGRARRARRRGAGRGGGARRQQRCRRAGAGRHRAGRRSGDRGQPAASWSRSVTASGSPTCWSRPVPGCARWAPPTGSRWPTTPPRSGRTTGFVLKVHPSNFVVHGFTASVPTAELATLPAPVVVGHRLRAARPERAAAGRAGRRVGAAGRRRAGHRQRRQAARRPAGRAAARPRRRRRPAAPPPAGPRAAGGQADPGRAGGDAARAGDADAGALAGRRGRPAAAGRAARRAAAIAGVDAVVVDSSAVVGGGGAPGVSLPSAAVSLPEPYAEPLRAGDPAVVGRVERGPLPARPARGRGDRRRGVRRPCSPCPAGLARCTSSPPPGTSTTASRPWSGR